MLPNVEPLNVSEDISSPNREQSQGEWAGYSEHQEFKSKLSISYLSFQGICNAEILQIFHRNANVELERKTRDLLRLTCVMIDRQIIIPAAHRHEYIDLWCSESSAVPDKWRWINVPDRFIDRSSEVDSSAILRKRLTWSLRLHETALNIKSGWAIQLNIKQKQKKSLYTFQY